MEPTNKISTKKVVRFAVGALLVAVFVVALVAASNKQDRKTVQGLKVVLNDENDYSFLQQKDIEKLLLDNRHIDLNGTEVAHLDLKKMEATALTNPWVAKADVYLDNQQVLNVKITQRDPLVRIFDVNGRSYYMDSALHSMPVTTGFAYAAPVFTNVPLAANDSLQEILFGKINYLGRYISNDSFWKAQVTQVEVQPDHTFVLSTVMGNQKILLGDTSSLSIKFNHLFAFYKNVSAKIGWDKYDVLDARFNGQIVASPALGWVPPKNVDTAGIIPEGPAPNEHSATVAMAAKPTPTNNAKKASATAVPAAIKKATAATTKVSVKNAKVAQAKKPEKSVAMAKAKSSINDKEKPQSDKPQPKYIYKGSGQH
ncbi:MAG: hypothetical protein QM642_01375 [Edaphocola sp.]